MREPIHAQRVESARWFVQIRQSRLLHARVLLQGRRFIVIEMTGEYESSVYDRRLLIYNLNDYHGPHTKALQKIEDPEQRKKAIEPNDIYSGPVPLAGTPLAGIR